MKEGIDFTDSAFGSVHDDEELKGVKKAQI